MKITGIPVALNAAALAATLSISKLSIGFNFGVVEEIEESSNDIVLHCPCNGLRMAEAVVDLIQGLLRTSSCTLAPWHEGENVCFLESDVSTESSTENEMSMSSWSSSSVLNLANNIKRTFGLPVIVRGRTIQGLEITLGGTGCDLKEGK
jgi:hypothetical protein